ncbi:MAG: Peptide deformylase [Eubacteriales bacterium SKADARSKE-1]|nr:Peptide deformylase [Eubacteriales bacterium SKADARSKE-1]
MKKFMCIIFFSFLFSNVCLVANAQVLDVLTDEHPTLRSVCIEVQKFDEETSKKVQNVTDTLEKLQGAGLAANQVGYTERFFTISSQADGIREYYNKDFQIKDDQPLVFINPRIIKTEGVQTGWEACFSLKGFAYQLVRPMSVVVEALDVHGNPFKFEAKGFWAKCICHEYDHLNGILCKDNAIKSQPIDF